DRNLETRGYSPGWHSALMAERPRNTSRCSCASSAHDARGKPAGARAVLPVERDVLTRIGKVGDRECAPGAVLHQMSLAISPACDPSGVPKLSPSFPARKVIRK